MLKTQSNRHARAAMDGMCHAGLFAASGMVRLHCEGEGMSMAGMGVHEEGAGEKSRVGQPLPADAHVHKYICKRNMGLTSKMSHCLWQG